ncbi:uncharacterized protein C8A04DRAFT_10004 [Dichotomopilus funicola]|uniref:FHA domain-containing protein n=1 Tax=Dichotomopilus funicola TaxID=1934379 RepID=A0AAN6V786_9PEZI|nr:hypothetical protein C8A04DRAFT_10004 [Dichotomopilus funicola]
MFSQPATSPTSTGPGNLVVSPVTATPAASAQPSRSSRLRGLASLRNYTQTHILSRETSSHSSHSHSPAPAPASSAPSPSAAIASTNPWFSALRSDSAPTPEATGTTSNSSGNTTTITSSTNNPSSSARPNRFSQLVPTLSHPTPNNNNKDGNASRSAKAISTPHQPTADDNMTRARSATAGDALTHGAAGSGGLDALPSIRFSTFFDPRATRPSLKFSPISRTLPSGKEIIRVGRYSERDNQPNAPSNAPSAAPVGFKSKVVSRRHCEFWYEDGKWYIKDVKSSSGTFLNHIRLSPPGTESKPYPINDGDIVQLGIDFKGGEEMIFRCVKMRLELNRGWQNKLNTFNIAPCQCLFVAPCSHTWHYKCIRSLLASPSYPIFICPNCRAATDLEAEVEDPEEWEQLDSDEGVAAQEGALLQAPNIESNNTNGPVPAPPRRSRESVRSARLHAAQQQQQQHFQRPPSNEVPEVTMILDSSPSRQESPPPQFDGVTTLADPSALSHALSNPMPIPSPGQRSNNGGILGSGGSSAPEGHRSTNRTPSPTGGAPATNGHEGPITPRNDAGPWVFDGSGVRLSQESSRPAAAALSGAGSGAAPSRPGSIEAAVQAAGGLRALEDEVL